MQHAIHEDLTQCVGNTPLVRLDASPEGAAPRYAAKVESFNPLWSVKDRIGRAMIDAAERDGKIGRTPIIIEPTSGNTGIGLAFVCAARGYKLQVTMPESMSLERRRMLKALGAEVILTPAAEGMAGAVRTAEELAAERPAVTSSRSSSRTRPTRRSIARPRPRRSGSDTGGKVDIFVAGVGTGGTITGVGEVLKSRKPGVQIVAVEPAVSPVITQHRAGPAAQAGQTHDPRHRRGLHPDVLNLAIHRRGRHRSATKMRPRPPDVWRREEGIMCGISSGAAAWAALEVARREENRGKTVVVVLPDLGERYLSTRLFPE